MGLKEDLLVWKNVLDKEREKKRTDRHLVPTVYQAMLGMCVFQI